MERPFFLFVLDQVYQLQHHCHAVLGSPSEATEAILCLVEHVVAFPASTIRCQ